MQAMTINQFGSAKALTIQQRSKPAISATQVLVKVHAFSVSQLDVSLRTGQLKGKINAEFPLTSGWDLAGEIIAVGEQVTDFLVGDAVLAHLPLTTPGAAAEYVAVEAAHLAYKPKNVSFSSAAALPSAGLTAWQAIVTHLAVYQGEQLLITAAATCTGQLATQLAVGIGAQVTLIAPHDAKALKQTGVQIYESTATIQQKFAAILDLAVPPLNNRDFLRPDGTYFAAGSAFCPQADGTELQHLVDLLSHEKLALTIKRQLPFSELGLITAQRLVEAGPETGKIVVNVIAD